MSHSALNYSCGAPLCIRIFLVSKKNIHKRGYRNFLLKIFCLTMMKIFLREPFSVSESLGYRNNLCIKRIYNKFLWKIFCLTVPKIFVWEPFCVLKKFWCRENLLIKGDVAIFCRKFFVSQCQKSSYRSP